MAVTGARVTLASAVTVESGAEEMIAWDTESADSQSYWASGNPTRLTIPEDNWYFISGAVALEQVAGGTFRTLRITVDGSTVIAEEEVLTQAAQQHIVIGTAYYLTSGSYVELGLTQASGSDVDVLADEENSHFTIIKVDANGCRVKIDTDQEIPHNNFAAISWDSEVRDDGGFWSAAAPTRFTAPSAGWYLFGSNVAWESSTSGVRMVSPTHQGTTNLGYAMRETDNVADLGRSEMTAYYLEEDEYVEFHAYHTHGVGLDVTVAANWGTEAWIIPCALGARITDASAETVTTATDTVLAMDTDVDDPSGWHDTSDSQIVAPANGWYVFGGHMRWANNSTGDREMYFDVNGTSENGKVTVDAKTLDPVRSISAYAADHLAASDYIEMTVNQSCGSNLATVKAAGVSPEVWMVQIGTGGTSAAALSSSTSSHFEALVDELIDAGISPGGIVGMLNSYNGTSGVGYAKARRTALGLD